MVRRTPATVKTFSGTDLDYREKTFIFVVSRSPNEMPRAQMDTGCLNPWKGPGTLTYLDRCFAWARMHQQTR